MSLWWYAKGGWYDLTAEALIPSGREVCCTRHRSSLDVRACLIFAIPTQGSRVEMRLSALLMNSVKGLAGDALLCTALVGLIKGDMVARDSGGLLGCSSTGLSVSHRNKRSEESEVLVEASSYSSCARQPSHPS